MKLFNVKNGKLCAFCRYWYDPSNSAIVPENTMAGFWQYDEKKTSKCLKDSNPRPSWCSCGNYECKV